jgi:hypothetical protein
MTGCKSCRNRTSVKAQLFVYGILSLVQVFALLSYLGTRFCSRYCCGYTMPLIVFVATSDDRHCTNVASGNTRLFGVDPREYISVRDVQQFGQLLRE